MSRPFAPRNSSFSSSFVRVNGKIRSREVRVIGVDNKQVGILSLSEALNMARANGVDLVEVSANATPPVCRLVDYGKYRYELAKKEKESKKHQHATIVKEVQLSPRIDAHDLSVKITHAIDFLCEDMKVKVTLKFRGREMAHTEFGFQVVKKFLAEIEPFGHPDFPPKLIGKGINVMISPLPRNKRAKNPNQAAAGAASPAPAGAPQNRPPNGSASQPAPAAPPPAPGTGGFSNNPFGAL
ncbi:MAG: translation initiation factor IF-3 [Verrucomicrobiota bacterium]